MDLMTGKELEKHLGGVFSYWTILELAKAGKLPHIRVGRRIFFRKQAVEDWLLSLEAESTRETEEAPKYGQLRQVRV